MGYRDELKKKAKLLAQIAEQISKKASKIEREVINAVLAAIFDRVDLDASVLKKMTSTSKVMDDLTKIFAEMAATSGLESVLFVASQLDKLSTIEGAYFISLDESQAKQVGKLLTSVNKDLDEMLGIERYKNGKVKGIKDKSVLSTYVNNKALEETLRKEITAAVSSGQTKTFIKERIETVVGGSVSEQLTDVVYAKSRAESKELGDTLGMNQYYIYNGTPVDTSRPFCNGGTDKKCGCTFEKKKGKVFTIEEIESWKDQNWMGKPDNYDPFNPFMGPGGFNCRDVLSPINETTAFRLRPELKQ